MGSTTWGAHLSLMSAHHVVMVQLLVGIVAALNESGEGET